MTLSDKTDSDLLLEVARMKYPNCEVRVSAICADDVAVHAKHGTIRTLSFGPNTIHPLWAEYAERYYDYLIEQQDDMAVITHADIAAIKDKAFEASLTLRGMLEAVWTVLKEAK